MKLLKIAALISILFIPTQAQTEKAEQVCFADAYGVHRHSPDAWPSWTYNMPGHKGQKCWYPSKRKVHSIEIERIKHRIAAIHTPKGRVEQLVVPAPHKGLVAGSSPATATIQIQPQRKTLKDWGAIMSGNAYVALMWP